MNVCRAVPVTVAFWFNSTVPAPQAPPEMNVPPGTFGPLIGALFVISAGLQLAMVAVFKPKVVVRLSEIVVVPGVVLGVQTAFETWVVAPMAVLTQGNCAQANEL